MSEELKEALNAMTPEQQKEIVDKVMKELPAILNRAHFKCIKGGRYEAPQFSLKGDCKL